MVARGPGGARRAPRLAPARAPRRGEPRDRAALRDARWGCSRKGFGYDVGLADLLLINISVSLLASFIPIPGGIGVAELGLTVGLSAAGMPEDAALAAALLYRVSTFYLPPVWGFFAIGWLRRNALL